MGHRTGTNHGAGIGNALDLTPHDAPLALDGPGDGAACRSAILDVAHRRLRRLGLGAVGNLRFRDMHRASCQQGGPCNGGGQFRQGQFYRHEQALFVFCDTHPKSAAGPAPVVCLVCVRKRFAMRYSNRVNYDSGVLARINRR